MTRRLSSDDVGMGMDDLMEAKGGSTISEGVDFVRAGEKRICGTEVEGAAAAGGG